MTTSITQHTDPDGRACVSIELANAPGRHAVLYLGDYLHFVDKHGFGPWHLGGVGKHLYVRTHTATSGRPMVVAKFITGSIPHSAARYYDDDHCNLRRSNLYLIRWGRDKSKIRELPRGNHAASNRHGRHTHNE